MIQLSWDVFKADDCNHESGTAYVADEGDPVKYKNHEKS